MCRRNAVCNKWPSDFYDGLTIEILWDGCSLTLSTIQILFSEFFICFLKHLAFEVYLHLFDFCHLKAKSKTVNACTLMAHRESNSLLRHYDCLAWPSEPFQLWPSVPLSPLMGCSWRQWNHSRPLTAQSPITDHRTKSPLDQKSQASYEPPSYVLNHIWL